MSDEGDQKPPKRARTERTTQAEGDADAATGVGAAGSELPAAACPAAAPPPPGSNLREGLSTWSVDQVQQWFAEHREGKWKEYAVKFAGAEGVDLCKMSKEDFLSFVDNHPHGILIFNDIDELKKQASSSSSESSPGSAAGPSEHVSLWAALREAERKQSTAVTLNELEADPSRFVQQQTSMGDKIAELEVKIADAGLAPADDGAAGAAAGDVGDGARAAATAAAQDPADDTILVVTLPEGIKWMTEKARHMFVRPCWVKLYGIIVSKMEGRVGTEGEGIILTGNPGIGKSWFLSYVLYRSATEMPTRTVVFESVAKRKLWIFGSDGSVRWERANDVEVVPELNDPLTIYLFDPAGHSTGQTHEPYRCLAFTVIASSLNRNNYQDMLKHGGKILYMPPWLLPELRTVAPFMPKPPSAQDVAERFARHGGFSRAVLSDDPELWDRELSRAAQSCDLDAVMRSVGLEDAVESATHKVVAYNVIEDGTTPYTDVRVDFVSPYVAKLVFDRYYLAKRAALATFLRSAQRNSAVAGVCGTLFEQLVHRTLVNGGTFKLRRLDEDADTTYNVVVRPLTVERVRGVSEVGGYAFAADKPVYVQPEFGNFPVLDGLMHNATDGALLSRFVGIQSTVSLHHPLKQAPLGSILRKLGITESVGFDVVFAVWPSTFQEFKSQPYVTVDNNKVSRRVPALIKKAVRQWVLVVPLTEPAGSSPD